MAKKIISKVHKQLKIYEYPKCSTCVKALKFLAENAVDFVKIDITQNPPTKAEIKQMIEFYQGDYKKLFNTSGIQYRELKISEKIQDISVQEAIDLLAGNGRLVKRPFLMAEQAGLVGFKEIEWKALLDL